jgi:hypothetical protein
MRSDWFFEERRADPPQPTPPKAIGAQAVPVIKRVVLEGGCILFVPAQRTVR